MKWVNVVGVLCCLVPSYTLFSQHGDKERTSNKTEKSQQVGVNAVVDKIKPTSKDANVDVTQLEKFSQEAIQQLKPDTLPKPNLKKNGDILEKKATNHQYDSDNPDDAPWKKEQFTKDDLKDLDLPSLPNQTGVPSVHKDKAKAYKEKAQDLKPASLNDRKLSDDKQVKEEQVSKTKYGELDKARDVADSLITARDRIAATSLEQELSGAQRIYSQKYIHKLYDSLGVKKGDSLFRVAAALAKTETSKNELLEKINAPIKDKAGQEGVSLDEENQSLKFADAEKMNGLPDQLSKIKSDGLPNADLASLQLPQDVLSDLEPLSGRLTDSKYVPAIDSMRDVFMKAKRYSLDEDQVSEEIKRTAFKKKPRFIGKTYAEAILGFVSDSAFSIVQISPARAYHFTPLLSAGLGPHVSIQYEEKKINAVVGFRSFVKAEFWKQRIYAQVEDNFAPRKINRELARPGTNHSILAGCGGLLPLSKKIAINLSVLYRVNQEQIMPGGSPWVFRVGLSSLKNIDQQK